MTVQHLDHLNLSVANLDATLAWYQRVFGFEPMERGALDDGARWAIIQSGEALLCCYERPEREALDGDALHARHIHGLNHFGLRIDDRPTWEQTVQIENVDVLYGGAIEWPHSTAWYVLDPTGYEIEVALWKGDRAAFD